VVKAMHKFYFKNIMNEVIKVHSSIEDRSDIKYLRKEALEKLSVAPIIKVAFDTRRVNQYTDINPRRNLQYYHRSEPFITKDSSEQIKTMFKLKTAVDSIKEDFLGDPDWFDSYCRILSATLDRTLRVEQKDMDFFKPQMDYLQELLYLRYRLKDDDIEKLNEKELINIILDRDEKLLHKKIYSQYNNGGLMKDGVKLQHQITKGDDNLINKLFGDVKASRENKEVERSVTITISDKIKDEIKKEG
jgi:hypothetical protein